ncbi:MAG: KH domain-containing protein [Lachnospiraceae bacterium]|nr:KH domain-containing protein [Lachnospiraceae bacterium]
MDHIEARGKTKEEALLNAAMELKTTSDNLEYEVIDKGSAGFLGFIGRKDVVLKVWRKEGTKSVEEEFDDLDMTLSRPARKDRPEKQAKPAQEKDEKKQKARVKDSRDRSEAKPAAKNGSAAKPAKDNSKNSNKPKNQEQCAERPAKKEPSREQKPAQEKDKEPIKVSPELIPNTEKFVKEVLAAMGMPDAGCTIDFSAADRSMNINVSGENMGVLIGKRGQTLDSLQYIISLVVNKESDAYIRVKLDTEDYRDRRRATLENLAKNIAFKVKRSKKAVALEPMNPYERRIIHSALQNDRFVETHSEGDEPFRKVVVTLKKEYRDREDRRNGEGGQKRDRQGRNGRSNRGRYNRNGFKAQDTEGQEQAAAAAEPLVQAVPEAPEVSETEL